MTAYVLPARALRLPLAPKNQRRKLEVVGNTVALARHPADAWQLAEPYPMSAFTRRALGGLVRAICPPSPAPQLADLLPRVELHVRRFMRYMSPLAARGLWLAILLLDWFPRFSLQSFWRLQSLDRRESERLLTSLVASRFALARTLVMGVRGVILCAYFDQDEVHRALDYAPVPFMTERTSRRLELVNAEATPLDRNNLAPPQSSP